LSGCYWRWNCVSIPRNNQWFVFFYWCAPCCTVPALDSQDLSHVVSAGSNFPDASFSFFLLAFSVLPPLSPPLLALQGNAALIGLISLRSVSCLWLFSPTLCYVPRLFFLLLRPVLRGRLAFSFCCLPGQHSLISAYPPLISLHRTIFHFH